MKKLIKPIRTAFIFAIMILFLCGFLYPLTLTGVSQLLFPKQANGSKEEIDGKVVGSSLIGQDFSDSRLFHCRPSAYNYNTYTQVQKDNDEYGGLASGSNNFANSNPALKQRIKKDIASFLKANPTIKREEIPADIISASGSGLDPHISIKAAEVQIDRVATHSGLSKKVLHKMIDASTTYKVMGIFGEDIVNVLHLNLLIAKEIELS